MHPTPLIWSIMESPGGGGGGGPFFLGFILIKVTRIYFAAYLLMYEFQRVFDFIETKDIWKKYRLILQAILVDKHGVLWAAINMADELD